MSKESGRRKAEVVPVFTQYTIVSPEYLLHFRIRAFPSFGSVAFTRKCDVEQPPDLWAVALELIVCRLAV